MGIFSDACYKWLEPTQGPKSTGGQDDPVMQSGRGRGTTSDFSSFGGGTVLQGGIYTTGKAVLNSRFSRKVAVGYSPLRRAVSLISGSGARIITNGLLRIETSVGARRVEPTGLEYDLLVRLADSVDGCLLYTSPSPRDS